MPASAVVRPAPRAEPRAGEVGRRAVTPLERRVARLKGDVAHWAATCFYILDKQKRRRRLVFNAVQRAIHAEERRQLRTRGRARLYVLKGRQGGITTYEQACALHLAWSRRGATALTLAHDRDATDKIFSKVTSYAVEHFPPGLLPVLGPAQTREVSFPSRESHFYTGTAGAGRTGRGLTIDRLHGSEFAFWNAPTSTLGTITPALIPFGSVVTLETTASDYDGDAHHYWRAARAGRNSYAALFFPWWQCDPLHYRTPLLAADELGRLEDDEADLAQRVGLVAEQIKWRREQIADMGRAEFFREYPEDDETCWLTAGGLFYDADLLKVLLHRAEHTPPVRVEDDGALEHYSALAPGERCIMGCDTAEGGGGDRSAWTARAFPSWRKLAVFRSAAIEPKGLAAHLNLWGRHFAARGAPALLVIEKNLHGITVLRHLRDDHGYPVPALYHRQTHDAEHARDGVTGRLGWATTAESKPLLLDAGRELLRAARDGHADVPSVDAIRDAFGVRRQDGGGADLNGRDVLVSEMLAWVGRTYSAPKSVARPYVSTASVSLR